jgi:outer membrane protein insertion porin family/translocation and assembly module TamA
VPAMSVSGSGGPHGVALVLAMVLLVGTTGCYRVPPGKSAIATVDIQGTPDVDKDDLAEHITTRETSRFLGVIYGFVYDYELFDRYALRRDLARIERYMRARGFYDAHIRAARVVPDGDKVHVTVEVEEGRPVIIETPIIVGDDAVEKKARERLRKAIEKVLPTGARLDEEKVDEAEKAAVKALTARGHAGARVERRTEVDLASATARVTFTVTPGPVAKIGTITWKGTGELPEPKLREVFAVKEGDVYSSEELDEAKQALLELGAFSSVEIALDTRELTTTKIVPLTITCEVSKLRAIVVGGGLELDPLKTDVHGTIGWQSANFLGNLRRFEVRLTPGVVLYPTRISDGLQPPKKLLFEEKLYATVRQPAFLESRTTGLARADYSIYPVLLPGATTQDVLGYHEVRGTFGLERMFFGHLFVSPQYGAQGNFPFDYLGKTQDVQTLVISYLDVFSYLDFRDDPIHTRKGIYIGNQMQLAGGPLQGDATDFRIQPEVRGYIPLTKRIVFASRASVGFLFPVSYGKYAEINFRNEGPSRVDGSARDYQILFFRGFFAGGPASNRGYALRGIGPYDVIPYLSPAGQSVSASGCNPNDKGCTLPTGGRSLWEANAEVRFVIQGAFSVATFCDAADVSPFSTNIRLERPHLSCGAGGRYDTPVGPIRLDIGYRIPGAQYDSSSFERPPDTLLGLPIALAFGIGEAF